MQQLVRNILHAEFVLASVRIADAGGRQRVGHTGAHNRIAHIEHTQTDYGKRC